MNYRKLGKWGLKISEVSLGSWMTRLASEQQAAAAQEVVNFAYENGINFFDCADAYSGGEAERFLGRCLAPCRRSSLVISSKVYLSLTAPRVVYHQKEWRTFQHDSSGYSGKNL